MTSTALGAETKKEEKIIFISDAHEKFYYEKLKEVRYQDVYHKALCYCLGISDDTRRNVYRIYDFKNRMRNNRVFTRRLADQWKCESGQNGIQSVLQWNTKYFRL